MADALHFDQGAPPLPRSLVFRERLVDRLRTDINPGLVFVHGQAGQGKTTLASSLVHTLTSPWLWIELDRQDRTPLALCAKLFTCLALDPEPSQLQNQGDAGAALPEIRTERLYRSWSQSFAGWIQPNTTIVLDGLESLPDDSPSLSFLQTLLRECLPVHRFVVLSRRAPPECFHTMVLNGQADLLDNDDLAFTVEDVESFFRGRLHRVLSKEVWEWLLAETEGWPAGLSMLAAICDHRPPGNEEEEMITRLSPRLKEAAADYFQRTVLAELSGEEREMLIRCSLFDPLDPALARSVARDRSALPALKRLCRDRVFLSPVPREGRDLAFRIHPLFRAVLSDCLEEETPEELRLDLLNRAGQAHERQDQPIRALSCYLQAGAFDRGAAILRKTGPGRLRAEHLQSLSPLLERFPQDMLADEPWLLLFKALATRFRELDTNIRRLKKARSLFARYRDDRGRLLTLTFLLEAIVFRGRDLVSLKAIMDEAQSLLDSLGLDAFPEERVLLLLQLGYVCSTRLGQAEKGYRLCQQAGWLANRLQRNDLSCLATLYTGLVLVWCGDLRQAQDLFRTVHHMPFIAPRTDLQAMLHMAWGGMAAIKGDSQASGKHLQEAQDTVTRCGLIYLTPLALFYDIFLHLTRKEYRQAEQACRRLLGYAQERDNEFLYARTLLWLGVTRTHLGSFSLARTDFEQAMARLGSKTCSSASHLLLAKILNGINAIHLRDTDYALAIFTSCLQEFEHQANGLLETCARIGRVLARHALGSREGMQSDLEKVLEDLGQWEARGLIFVRDQDLRQVCILALGMKLDTVKPIALHLWEQNAPRDSSPEPDQETGVLETAVIRGLQRKVKKKQVPQIEIKTLGTFEVWKDSQDLGKSSWGGNLPKRLLKVAIARGGEGVAVSQIQEDIWPDCDSAHGRFKIALHRLRTALEPDYDPNLGSTYVHLHQDRLWLAQDLFSIDVSSFEKLALMGGLCEDRDEASKAMAHYSQALDLYRGEFLPEEALAPWAESKRRDLKSTHLSLLMSCARLSKQRGANNRAVVLYQRAVAENPLYEEGYRQLMILYTNMKLYNEALQAFEACKASLQSHLGTDPDPLTVSLWRKALSKLRST